PGRERGGARGREVAAHRAARPGAAGGQLRGGADGRLPSGGRGARAAGPGGAEGRTGHVRRRGLRGAAAAAAHDTADGPARVGADVRTRPRAGPRSEEHTSELQSRFDLVCRLLLEKKKKKKRKN